MKTLLAITVLAASLSASAAIVRIDCNFSDYKRINSALSTTEVAQGEELLTEVVSLLNQEMGPTCKRLVDTVMRVDIPGRRRTQYELSGAGITYTIEIGTQVESAPFQWVSLFKTRDR